MPGEKNMTWALLMHISYNLWTDYTPKEYEYDEKDLKDCQQAFLWAQQYHPFLTCNKPVWDDILQKAAGSGINMVILDLGDGIQYESHPEIAVKNAWTISQLKAELKKMRQMGLEPIPKLNFSACHKAWLGPYQRMISTKEYREVCADLINEVCEIFDKPRLFHLGMDEEDYGHQAKYQNVVVRQGELWWQDFYHLLNAVEKNNVRAWIWSDYIWHHEEAFLKKMPKTVLQSNWYYMNNFGDPSKDDYVSFYGKLEEHGYDQMPTGTNHYINENFASTVKYCTENISAERLKGFVQTVWRPVLPTCKQRYYEGIEQVEHVLKNY